MWTLKEKVKGWRKLHNKELCILYSSPNINMVIKARKLRWMGHLACMEYTRHAHILFEKLEGKRSLGRHRQRWENNTEMNVRAWTGFNWLRTGSSGKLLRTW